MLKNKKFAAIIATILALSIAIPFIPILPTNAQTVPSGMNWDLTQTPSSTRLLLWERYHDEIPATVYSVISPDPVGVGQQVSVVLFNPQQPPAASATNDIRYVYSVIIEKPDGTTQTLGPITSDSTGTAYTLFTPDQTGNYTITAKFHELKYNWHDSSTERNYYGTTFKEAIPTQRF